MNLTTPRLLAPALALGLALTGCATSTPEDAGQPEDTAAEGTATGGAAADEDTAAAEDAGTSEGGASLIAAAVDASADITTARTRFSSVVETPQGDVEISGEGTTAGEAADISMTMGGQAAATFGAEEVTIDVRLVDGVMYQRFAQLSDAFGTDAEWISFDLATIAPEFEQTVQQARQLDPAESLASLREVADVAEVGRETLNGVETTHYTGEMQLRAAIEAAGTDPAMLEGSGIDLDQTVPVDVWIDDEGLVRRYDSAIEVQGMTTTSTFEVLEYGADVEVTAPPAEATASFEELVGQQGG